MIKTYFIKNTTLKLKNIRLEPKDIKYGWVIFQIPEILKNRRIERYRIIVQDVENNVSKAESLLIKEIHYDD